MAREHRQQERGAAGGAGRRELVLTSVGAAPSCVGLARRFVVDAVRRVGLADVEDQAELLVSEVVSNAVIHGHSPVRLELTTDDQTVTVKVHDEGCGWPRVEHVSRWSERGRGLELVELASDRWGVELTEHGKYVWFELRSGDPPLN